VKPRLVIVNDLMQQGYEYWLTKPVGENFHPDFQPDLTPKEMLEMGVFGGKYLTDSIAEFFWSERLQTALVLAKKRMDLSRRSTRLVSVVLPLLHGKKMPGR
jgi:hypothetical protein